MERKPIQFKARVAPVAKLPLPIRTPFIELQAALKLSGIAQTGGHAKVLITEEERVFVNEEICTSRGKKLYPGDTFRVGRECYEIVAQ